MSFGRHFLPADYVKPYADIGKFYDELIEKEIRSKITAPDPVLHRLTQEAGRRFELGVDADAVKEHVKSQVVRETAKRQQAKDEAASSAALYSPPAKTLDEPTYRDEKPFEIHHSHYKPPPKGKLSLTDVIQGNNVREGGRFHRRDVVDVYAPHFEVRHPLSDPSRFLVDLTGSGLVYRRPLPTMPTHSTRPKCGRRRRSSR